MVGRTLPVDDAATDGQCARGGRHGAEATARLLVRQGTRSAKIGEMTRLQWAFWLLAGLTALALLFSSQLYVAYRAEGIAMPFGAIFLMQIGHWYGWALAGPVVWSLTSRWPLHVGRRMTNALRHLA